MCQSMEELWREGIEQGIEQGFEQGIEQGKARNQRQTALRMLDIGGFSLEKIAQISGMPIEKIKALQQER